MATRNRNAQSVQSTIKNGPAAAALLAGGIAAVVYGLLIILSERVPVVAPALNWYNPVGPLSGTTSLTIILWLSLWAILGNQWKDKDVSFQNIAATALVLLVIGFLLTLPFEFFIRLSGGE